MSINRADNISGVCRVASIDMPPIDGVDDIS